MNIKQRQAVLGGKLTLTNPANQGEYGGISLRSITPYMISNLREGRNIANYKIFTSPDSPGVRILENNEEVGEIRLGSSSSSESVFEIISPHPFTVQPGRGGIIRRSGSIEHQLNLIGGDMMLTPFEDFSGSYTMSLGDLRMESDGYYHRNISFTTTLDNTPSAEPITLGDVSIVSQIYDSTVRADSWVKVENGSNALDIVKTLLRTDNPRIINVGSIPSQAFTAIPGTAFNYAGSYWVIPEYGLIKEVADPDSFDYIPGNQKYYYNQEAIDNLFGVSERVLSVIQNGAYFYRLLGPFSNTMIEFPGETRTFRMERVNSTQLTAEGFSGFTIINPRNCTITVGSDPGTISMTVPTRIPNYTPKPISNTYYTTLVNYIPVSFETRVSSTGSGDMVSLNMYLKNSGGLGASNSIPTLMSRPVDGTSGMESDYSEAYYKDPVTGLTKYIQTIERYSEDGYTSKICERGDWEVFTVDTRTGSTQLQELIQEEIDRYGSNDVILNGILEGTDIRSIIEPNTDDILFTCTLESITPSPGSRGSIIYVDEFPVIGKITLNPSQSPIIYAKRPVYGESTSYTYKYYKLEMNSTITCYRYLPKWRNYSSIGDLYHAYGLGRKYNGYYWVGTPETFGGTNRINSAEIVMPNDAIPSAPIITPSYTNYKRSYYIWSIDSNAHIGYISVNELPQTRGQADTGVWYKYGNNYYQLITMIYTCEIKPIYSLVAVNGLPETYSSSRTYNKGDLVSVTALGVTAVYKSLVDNNTSTPMTVSNSDWVYYSSIVRYIGADVKYKYYRINPTGLTNYSTVTSLPNLVSSSSPEYIKIVPSIPSGTPEYASTEYYRRGFDLIQGNEASIGEDWYFSVTLGDSSVKYYQLKRFALEALLPDNCSTISNDLLKSVGCPGNVIVKGDTYCSGFGYTSSTSFGTNLLYDFNQYRIRYTIFSRKSNFTQKSISNGIVANFDGDYKLYLSNDSQNTIEVHVSPDTTSYSGFAGIFDLHSAIVPESGSLGLKPDLSIIEGTANTTLENPILDGNGTPNFIAEFPENTGDQDIIRRFKFYYSENGFSSSVILKIIQGTDPGIVTPTVTSRKIYFLSNGLSQLPNNLLTFSSTIQNMTLQNIQVINEIGEDLLDREESFVQQVSQSTTYSIYSAFLKLKPNTSNNPLSGFRIKIGKVSGSTVTDRTLDESTANFYRFTSSGWVLLGQDYQPTYREPYYESLPGTGTQGEIICVCTSLRGWQGYYNLSLYKPGYDPLIDQGGIEWRSSNNLGSVIQDLVVSGSNLVNLNDLNIIVDQTELPDIRTIKEVGVIYKIGDTYYYTYADYITSNYSYGTTKLPISLTTSREDYQNYHLEVEQCEYDINGVLMTPINLNDYFNDARNFRTQDSNWVLRDLSGNEVEDLQGSQVCSLDIIYTDTLNPDLTPYLQNQDNITGYPVSGSIVFEARLKIRLLYNNISGMNMSEEYRWIDNLFTIYTQWSNS